MDKFDEVVRAAQVGVCVVCTCGYGSGGVSLFLSLCLNQAQEKSPLFQRRKASPWLLPVGDRGVFEVPRSPRLIVRRQKLIIQLPQGDFQNLDNYRQQKNPFCQPSTATRPPGLGPPQLSVWSYVSRSALHVVSRIRA